MLVADRIENVSLNEVDEREEWRILLSKVDDRPEVPITCLRRIGPAQDPRPDSGLRHPQIVSRLRNPVVRDLSGVSKLRPPRLLRHRPDYNSGRRKATKRIL